MSGEYAQPDGSVEDEFGRRIKPSYAQQLATQRTVMDGLRRALETLLDRALSGSMITEEERQQANAALAAAEKVNSHE